MANLTKDFFLDVLIYSIGNFLKKITSFILLPLLTYVLTPKEYGLLSLTLTSVTLLVTIFSAGLDNATTFYYYKTDNTLLKGQILYTKLLIRLFLIIPLIVVSAFSNYFSFLLFDNNTMQITIIFACLLIATETLVSEQKHLYRLINKPKLFNFVNVSSALAYLFFVFVFLYLLQRNINGVLLAGIISGIVVFLISILAKSYKYYDNHFRMKIAKMLVFYGAPLIMIAITNWTYKWSDKFLINYFVGLKDVGLYAVANALSQPVLFIIIAFQLSYLPFFWKSYNNDKSPDKNESKLFVEKTFRIYFVFICLLAMLVSMFGKELTMLLTNNSYTDAYKALVFLIFAFVLDFAKRILMVGIFIRKKQKFNFLFLLISLIINVVLNLYFIPHYGFVGAALTTLIAFAINFLMIYFYTQTLFKVNINFWNIVVFFISTFIISFLFTILKNNWNPFMLGFMKLLCIIICFIMAIFLDIIYIQDIKSIVNQVKTYFVKLRN